MKYSVFSTLLIASVCVAVFATQCHHHDLSMCTGVVCTADTEEVGCDHDVCTCVPKPQSCLQPTDCNGITCEKHDEAIHCIDNICKCQKSHP
ncbi:uncharacterized protein LOC123545755 [Mercenaria mercenaria]|uniref:uncharacterized protein LOC123545755 n=1 Tax=Mercenaria mercenaria TaxID=6596 RepID=UPI00234F7183|nr:uncharacterized protein LOC123545755 [Mercenaria mercenaria]